MALGEFGGFVFGFVRHIVLARLLGLTDFGIVSAFSLSVQSLQTMSNMSLNVLLVQSPRGADPEFLATAHGVQIVRGLCSAIILFLVAAPLSALFDIPQALWALQWLSVVPVIEGFAHLDVACMERSMRFRPGIAVNLVPKLVAAAIAWPVAVWLEDFSAGLWLLVLQSILMVLVSHLMAEREYRVQWSVPALREIVDFGWPLLFNGILFVLISQGDRFLVGSLYGMSSLALYSVSTMLVMTTGASLHKILQSVILPPLARAQHDNAVFLRRHIASSRIFAATTALYGSGMIILGEPLIVALYGADYHTAGALAAWLAAGQAVRLLRIGPSLTALAKGDTRTFMYANCWRLIGVGLAGAAAILHLPLAAIAVASLLGELVALAHPVVRLARRHGIAAPTCARCFLAALATMSIAGLLVSVGARGVLVWGGAVVGIGITLGVGIWMAVAYVSFCQTLGHAMQLIDSPSRQEAAS